MTLKDTIAFMVLATLISGIAIGIGWIIILMIRETWWSLAGIAGILLVLWAANTAQKSQ